MRIGKSVGVCVVAFGVSVGGAVPAQALSVPGIIDQSVGAAQNTVRAGLVETAQSLVTYGDAHAFVVQNPINRPIVVLGARVNEDGTLPAVLSARLDTAAAIARAHPQAKVVASGGPTQKVPYSEAQAMLVGLTLRGVNPNNIVVEGTSASTVENARNTVGILARDGADGAVIVSSDSHIHRALDNFRRAAPDLSFVPVGVAGW